MTVRRLCLILAASAIGLSPAIAAASPILFEHFDELSVQESATSAGAFHTIDGTNVDIVGPGNGFGYLCTAPASGNCIDLDGSNGNSQGILQSGSIALDPGMTYDLTFDLLGSQRGNETSTTVDFGSYSQTFLLNSSGGGLDNVSFTVNSATTTNLTFTSNTPGNVGAILDNVAITATPNTVSPVPEPSSIVFTGTALLLAAGLIKGRRGIEIGASHSEPHQG